MAYDDTNTFRLFKNKKGDNPKRPDYRGEVNIGGVIYELAGWIRESKKDGSKFIAGAVKVKDAPKPAPTQPKPSSFADPQAEDDDIPF